MTRISFEMDTEGAMYTLLGCAALINSVQGSEFGKHAYESWGLSIVESALIACAIAIDRELYDGETTKHAPIFERGE